MKFCRGLQRKITKFKFRKNLANWRIFKSFAAYLKISDGTLVYRGAQFENHWLKKWKKWIFMLTRELFKCWKLNKTCQTVITIHLVFIIFHETQINETNNSWQYTLTTPKRPVFNASELWTICVNFPFAVN